MENINTEKAIKKWLPIIEHLNKNLDVQLLTSQQIELCLYAEEFSAIELKNTDNYKFTGINISPFIENGYNMLPIMLKILSVLLIKLRENNLSYKFSHDSDLNNNIVFKDDYIQYDSNSEYNTIQISNDVSLDIYNNIINKTGIDLLYKIEKIQIEQCIEKLYEYAVKNNGLDLKIGGNSFMLINDYNMSPKVITTFQIK